MAGRGQEEGTRLLPPHIQVTDQRLAAARREGHHTLLVALGMEDAQAPSVQIEVIEVELDKLGQRTPVSSRVRRTARSRAPIAVSGSQQARSLATSSGENGWTIFWGSRTLRSEWKGVSFR